MADTIPGDNTTTVNLTPGGAAVTGTIDTAGDTDWYRITLTAGQTYVFYMNPTATGGVGDSLLALRDSGGVVIASNDDRELTYGSTYSAITFTATTSGTYFLDASGFNTATGTFRIGATTVPAAEIPGSTATGVTLGIGATRGGSIETAGDQDWFAVNLTAGQRYAFTTDPGATGAIGDTILRLMDSSGAQLVINDDIDTAGGNTFSSIVFTPSTSGTYYLNVSGFGAGDLGSYYISATTRENLSTYTLDQIADQLINGYWEAGGGSARHFNVAPGGHLTVNINGLSAQGQFLATEALNLWSDVTGIIFDYQTGATAAQITFDDDDEGAYSSSNTSGEFITDSFVNVSLGWLDQYGTTINSYSFQTYIHEIGHALGLGHGGNYNGAATWGVDESYLNDVVSNSIMSYFFQFDNMQFQAQGFSSLNVLSPMLADIVAISQMYGTSSSTRGTATTYGFNSTAGRAIYDAAANPNVAYTIYDSGGLDTLDYTGFSQNQLIDLQPETWSNVGGFVGNVSIARGVAIEIARSGAGNDTLYGSAGDNRLYGGGGNDLLEGRGGNDWLIGSAGADTMRGGAGNDIYFIDASDVISESGGSGTADEVRVEFDYTLGTGLERLLLKGTAVNGTGNTADNYLLGNAVGNVLNGLDGSDRLFGYGGNDTLDGGNGNDFVYGGGGSDSLVGGSNDDLLRGDVGNDTLVGGAGRDLLYGDAGNDRFVFDDGHFAGMTATTADRIMDFAIGADRIDLSQVDANAGVAGDQAFSFIGSAAFSGAAGQLRAYTDGSLTIIEGNTNTGTVADFWIVLNGAMVLSGGDFVL